MIQESKYKFVFKYTHCCEPECWEWNIPFEYVSREKFILDVLDNPMLLNEIGISVHEFQIEDGDIWTKGFIEDITSCVLTLDEWFEKNKSVVKL